MEDEVRLLLLLLLLRLDAAAVSQLVSRRRVPDNGAATMWQSGAASLYNLKRPRRPENADTERLAPTCFQAGRRTRCPNLILVFKTCVTVIFWFVLFRCISSGFVSSVPTYITGLTVFRVFLILTNEPLIYHLYLNRI